MMIDHCSPPDVMSHSDKTEFQLPSPAKSSHPVLLSPPPHSSKKQWTLVPPTSAKVAA